MESSKESFSIVTVLCAVAAVISTIRLTALDFSLQEEIKNEAELLNNTRNAEVELLFFNRVPKVGSQTMMKILDMLSAAKLRNFSAYKDDPKIKAKVGERTFLRSKLDRKMYVEMFDNFAVNGTASYSKHISYIDFREFDRKMPIYINMVREPIQRVISWYYYIRAPWYIVTTDDNGNPLDIKSHLRDIKKLKMDYIDCVENQEKECSYIEGSTLREQGSSHLSQIMFFCGHVQECTRFNTKTALRMAIENVERDFAVVGVLEEMDKTLTVLEHYVPRFFKGVKKVYYEVMNDTHKQTNKNIYRPPVPEYIREMVRQNFTQELEFYEFCKQRLHKQYLALGLS